MKFPKAIVVIVLLFIVFSLISISFYLKYHGKYLLEDFLKISLDRNVAVGDLSIHFPLGVSIHDLKVSGSKISEGKNAFEVKKINVKFELMDILKKKIIIKEIVLVNPYIFIDKPVKKIIKESYPANSVVVEGQGSEEKAVIGSEEKKVAKPMEVYVEQMFVRKGIVEYIDSVSGNNISFTLKDFDLTLGELYIPFRSSKVSFDFRAIVAKANGPLLGSKAKGKGWIDIAKKDMEANLELLESDGQAGLTANFVSKNNDMSVQGDINVENFSLDFDKNDPGKNNVSDKVFASILSMGVEVGAHYSFKTKMDDFRVGNITLTGKVGINEN